MVANLSLSSISNSACFVSSCLTLSRSNCTSSSRDSSTEISCLNLSASASNRSFSKLAVLVAIIAASIFKRSCSNRSVSSRVSSSIISCRNLVASANNLSFSNVAFSVAILAASVAANCFSISRSALRRASSSTCCCCCCCFANVNSSNIAINRSFSFLAFSAAISSRFNFSFSTYCNCFIRR